MDIVKKIIVYGDSILKGVQINKENKRYFVDNNIDTDAIGEKFDLNIENLSKFGCTLPKGSKLIEKALENGLNCDALIMDFGGNDCDFNWKEVSDNPDKDHQPHTPLDIFIKTYKDIIAKLKDAGILPILTNLPPIEPHKYFNWFTSNGLNKENIMKWLGNVSTIYRYQENYSRSVEKIAVETDCPLVDLRGAFLKHRRIDDYLCEDGIHPNTAGQKLIEDAFSAFAKNRLQPITVK